MNNGNPSVQPTEWLKGEQAEQNWDWMRHCR